MVDARVVFGDVVARVGRPRPPVVPELGLGSAASEPVQAHVHGLESLAGDVVVDNAEGGGVVRLHRSRGLLVAHGFEGMPCGDGFAAVDEESTQFGFGRGGHDILVDFGDREDSAI